MLICWKPLRKGELDHELLWASVSCAAAIGLFYLLNHPALLPACPFHALTGYPCLTCGATRSVIQLSQGNLRAALGWNPGVCVATISLVLYNLYAAVVVLFRLPRIRVAGITPKAATAFRVTAWTLAALNWIYLLIFLH